MSDTEDLFGDAIYTYTRKQAIDDGEQRLLEGELAQIFGDIGYLYPVYITRSVITLIESGLSVNSYASKAGIIYDLAWMSRKGISERGVDYAKFQCYLPTANDPDQGELMEFYIQVGATDFNDPAPCMTLMTALDR